MRFIFYVFFIFVYNNGCSSVIFDDCALTFSSTPIHNHFLWCKTINRVKMHKTLNNFSISRNMKPININFYDVPKIIILAFIVVFLLWLKMLHLCANVNFITFNTNLTLYNKRKYLSSQIINMTKYLVLGIIGLLLITDS